MTDSRPRGFAAGDGSDIILTEGDEYGVKKNPFDFLNGYIGQMTENPLGSFMAGGLTGLFPRVPEYENIRSGLVGYSGLSKDSNGLFGGLVGSLLSR